MHTGLCAFQPPALGWQRREKRPQLAVATLRPNRVSGRVVMTFVSKQLKRSLQPGNPCAAFRPVLSRDQWWPRDKENDQKANKSNTHVGKNESVRQWLLPKAKTKRHHQSASSCHNKCKQTVRAGRAQTHIDPCKHQQGNSARHSKAVQLSQPGYGPAAGDKMSASQHQTAQKRQRQ